MKFCDFVVKNGVGKNTFLDKKYSRLISDVLLSLNEEKVERWETYNLIIKELLKIDDGLYFEEIKYRLTDNEDPNEVILDIVSRYWQGELSFLCNFLVKRVEEYREEDFLKRFYD